MTEKVGLFPVEFSIPRGAKTFLVCVRIHGCKEGKLYGTLGAVGMSMMAAGRVIP
jgi:hypothetical protein